MLAPFSFMGGGIDPQALEHYNRVIDDLGMVPAGLLGTNAWFKAVKGVYGTSDITTSISAGYDPHYLGVKSTLEGYASKLYSCSGADGDLIQNTDASMPLLLVKNSSDANYWFSPFVSNNFCTAPNISIPTNSGIELDLKLNLTSGNITESAFCWFFSHDNGAGSRPLFIGLGSSNILRVFWNNFTYTANSTASLPSPFNGWLRLKLESVSGNMVVTFSTSSDGVTFTQLGSQITETGAANTFLTTSVPVYTNSNNGANTSSGKYLRAIYKDANGVTRADFNPASYNPSVSQTQWTSTTGEVWSVNVGTAATGYKGVLVDRTILQGDGVDDTMISTSNVNLSTTSNITLFSAYKKQDSTDFLYELLVHNGTTSFGSGVNGYFAFAVANGIGKNFARITRNSLNSDSDITNANYNLKLINIKYINSTAPSSIENKINNVTNSSVNTFANTNGSFLDGPIIIFSNVGSNAFANVNLNTLIITSNTSDYDTPMYNFIRSFNNNAF